LALLAVADHQGQEGPRPVHAQAAQRRQIGCGGGRAGRSGRPSGAARGRGRGRAPGRTATPSGSANEGQEHPAGGRKPRAAVRTEFARKGVRSGQNRLPGHAR
jgi:hypothetical protein